MELHQCIDPLGRLADNVGPAEHFRVGPGWLARQARARARPGSQGPQGSQGRPGQPAGARRQSGRPEPARLQASPGIQCHHCRRPRWLLEVPASHRRALLLLRSRTIRPVGGAHRCCISMQGCSCGLNPGLSAVKACTMDCYGHWAVRASRLPGCARRPTDSIVVDDAPPAPARTRRPKRPKAGLRLR